jgi:galactose mutarotase-like enzyme
MRHLPVDEFGIPVGTSEEWPASSKPLGDTTYDDGFDMVPECSVFAIEGGGRRVEVTYEKDYPCAQLFAPPNGDLIAIEPMTAPTDALRRGNFRVAVAGNPEAARFSIKVT